MKRVHGAITAGLIGALMMMGVGPSARAQNAERAGQEIRQKLDNLGQTVRQGLKDAGDSLRQQFVKTRQSVHNMDLAARVYGRLHWDKCLYASEIELSVKYQIVTLTGVVPDAKARAKAVELARDTEGIREVKDLLTITPSESSSVPTSPSSTTTPRP